MNSIDKQIINNKIKGHFMQNKVGSIMTNQEIQDLANKRIGETLELLEMAGTSRKEIDVIRKAMWRLLDEFILIKMVGSNERRNLIK